jgi:DNA polymerase (family 10)
MPVHNAEIAEILDRYAVLLEIEGANVFRVRACGNAARTTQELPHSVAAMLEEGSDLSELPGIGKDLAGRIEAIVATGKFAELDRLENERPGALAEPGGKLDEANEKTVRIIDEDAFKRLLAQ